MFTFLIGGTFGVALVAFGLMCFFAGRTVESKGWKALLKWQDWRVALKECSTYVMK